MDVVHSTFTLERVYPAPVERVFDAWADPAARSRWMAQGAEHRQDFVVGGTEVVTGRDDHGDEIVYEGRFVQIVPNSRILVTSTMRTGTRLSTVSVASIEFREDGDATQVVHTEHGMYLPGQERPEWREQGTAQQLDTLAAEFAGGVGDEEER